MTVPTVSVIIPTYNRAAVLPRAIDSALGGTYGDVELHVVDGRSNDGTRTVVDGYDDDRLHYVRFQDNVGANVARNRGLSDARGEFVAFLDSDDAFGERYLQRCVDALTGSPIEVAGTYASRRWYRDGEPWNLTVANDDVTFEDLRRKNVVGGFSNVVFRASALEQVAPIDESLRYCDDYDLFLRVLKSDSRFRAVPDATVAYHAHGEGATRMTEDTERRVVGHRQFIEKHRKNLVSAGVANQYYQLGMAHARSGDAATARRWFRRGIATDPRSWRHWYHYLASLGGLGALRAAVGLKIGVKRHVYDLRHDPGGGG